MRDAVVERWGPEVAPGGVVDRAAVARRPSPTEQERRLAGGPAVAAGGGAHGAVAGGRARAAPAAARRGRRGAAAVRGGDGGALDATIAVIAAEQLRRERAAGRGHELVEERITRQLSQEEKARSATFVGAQRWQRGRVGERSCRRYLTSWSGEDGQMTSSTAACGHPCEARAMTRHRIQRRRSSGGYTRRRVAGGGWSRSRCSPLHWADRGDRPAWSTPCANSRCRCKTPRDPRAGRRKAPRSRVDRGGHLRRDQVRTRAPPRPARWA